jgi:pre-mRNA-processing factor 6
MKSAVFERQRSKISTAMETLSTALTKFPKFAKLYMIQGQIHQSQEKFVQARASFAAGCKACPKEVTLWVLASRLEEADGKSIKARALLEKARLINPANDVLWAEAIDVEERSGGAAQAKSMLARGLQECPTSGLLWSMSIWSEPRPMRKSRSVDALKKSADNPVIICTVARLFWAERKIEKARQWFGRAVVTDTDLGDSWGWWLKFERQHGTLVRESVLL